MDYIDSVVVINYYLLYCYINFYKLYYLLVIFYDIGSNIVSYSLGTPKLAPDSCYI